MIPFLPNCFASSFEASASSCGISRSSISTIVTSLPNVLKIDANSQPMIPPPRITSRLGTSVCASRPVESTQRSDSSPGIGGRIGNEPVAITADLNVTSSPPSTRIVFASLKVPAPFTHSTPFALKSEATPPVICLTTAAFHSFATPKSSLGSETVTPSFGNDSRAVCRNCAVCTQALVGMQPIRRQVPPSSGSFSMQITFAPSCAARIAAVYPPGPPPRTATSQSMLRCYRRAPVRRSREDARPDRLRPPLQRPERQQLAQPPAQPGEGTAAVVPRLSVLRTPRRAEDALPQMLQLMTSHMPLPLEPAGTRLALTHGGHHVYVVPERQGGVMLAVVPGGITDFVRTLSHDLVWLSLAQDPQGTLAVGLFADGVTKVEVDGHAATLGRNAFLYDARGRKAKQIESLLVTTRRGGFRMPLDKNEFRR